MSKEILVCGAGIVGLATALALGRRKQPVAILAPAPAPLPPAGDPYYPRVYAISPASQRFLAELGIWDALPAERIMPVQAMEIHGDADGGVTLDAWQAAVPQLAWIAESSEIERVLMQAARLSGISWIQDRCVGYENGAVLTEQGGQLRADLAIGADGAGSPLREAAGLRQQSRPYDDIALVTHLDAEIAHRGTALQWFREDGVLALLPLPDSARGPQVSLVWSLRAAAARVILALPPAQQAARLEADLALATGGRLGRLAVNAPVHGFPLFLEQSQMIAPGVALVGDAAHRVHPLAGQGLNLGLGDALALAEAVAGRESFRSAGDIRVLRRYRRARAEPLLAMRVATDGLHRLFGSRAAPLAWLRNTGMSWVDRTPALKRRLIAQASGL
ncbi:ubiquinone biosynthesis protein UbiH [Bordetella genomosp. 10]|uniref:Ubiquinone biosynthesis protein UbiH n=1 Tax=Bordetella genomosp. 10 TaxID=1416804 RepID=A0A261S534_9BORD|nr:UbiH/UbiF family hydroxylase [Bordetella genomosp. 10]OZI31900.1 ubiquinone biosynthesis protein UbiH [Bordetella genomosp. 10]